MRQKITILAILFFGCFFVVSNAAALALPAGTLPANYAEKSLQTILDENILGGSLDAETDQSTAETWTTAEFDVDSYLITMIKGDAGTLGIYSAITGAEYDLALTGNSVSFEIYDGALYLYGSANPIDNAFGESFGFYWKNTSSNYMSYTEDSENAYGYGDDENIMALSYLVPDGFRVNTARGEGLASGNNDWILAFEDRPNLDGDFNDAVFYVEDMTPTPEPTTVMLFGLGVLGMGAVSRKRLMRN